MRIPVFVFVLCCAASSSAQVVSQRGSIEGRGIFYPQEAVNDTTRAIGDVLFREEVTVRPAEWVQFTGGLDLRANSHDQTEHEWRLDTRDRSILRPAISLRRASASMTARGLTVDLGKQFIRWARTDVLNPIDRFAPRDFLNVIDSEFLPVVGARAAFEAGTEALEVVWVPGFTPSRTPLFDQRWTVIPAEATGFVINDAGSRIPKGSQYGARWRHTGENLEVAASYFDGIKHLPNIDVQLNPLVRPALDLTRTFSDIRSVGFDFAIPTTWVTLKGETAYFHATRDDFDNYALYVVEVERQAGEWLLTAGYAGEVTTGSREPLAFDIERGLARSVLARAGYTVDPQRTVVIEGAVRQNGDGQYVKGEFSQAVNQYLRLSVIGVAIGGDDEDFIGQFKRNSHISASLRLSF